MRIKDKKNVFVACMIGVMSMCTVLTSSCQKKDESSTEATTEDVLSLQQERTDNIKSGQVFDMVSDSGDVIHVTINNKRSNRIEYNESERTFKVVDENEKNLGKGYFLTEKYYKQYYKTVKKECEVIGDNFFCNVKYMYFSYTNTDGEKVNEILGWIKGSNSGVVFESTKDMSNVQDYFTDINFDVTETDQTNSEYICDPD